MDLIEVEDRPVVGEREGALTASELAVAFRGRMTSERVSWRYRFALAWVTVAMLLVPAMYVGLVVGVAVGTAIAARHGYRWAEAFFAGRASGSADLVVSVLGMAIGTLVFFFLVKPLLARPRHRAQPLALNPAAEPLLFALVGMVCDTVGAPHPVRIEVDCRVNASARYREGLLGLVRGELVLSVGLPVVAATNLRQFVSVLAHEFGHFGQRYGMRASALVRAINLWLARVATERDGWDEALEAWVEEGAHWRFRVPGAMALAGVGLSRAVLRGLMFAGQAVGCLLLREMEFQADRCEVAVAGSAAFETSRRRLRVLGELSRSYYRGLRGSWDLDRSLPDNFPRGLAAAEAALSDEERASILERADRREVGWFDAHPPDAERTQRARAQAAEGLFMLDGPATAVFSEFDVLARQATLVHYEDDLGLARAAIRLKSG